MRNVAWRNTAVAMAALMALATLAGCRDGGDAGADGYVYVAQSVPMPSDTGGDFNLVYCDGKVFFAAMNWGEPLEGKPYMYSPSYAGLCSMNIDGTGLTELAGYTPPVVVPEDVGGTVRIAKLITDGEGNLWVAEDWYFYRVDLPDDFDDENDHWGYYREIIDCGIFVRKLDSTGAQLLSVDISSLRGQSEDNHFSTFTVGTDAETGEERIYLYFSEVTYTGDAHHFSLSVYVTDTAGNVLFERSSNDIGNWMHWFGWFIHMPDGTVAFPQYSHYDSATGECLPALIAIDLSAKSLSDTITIPGFGWMETNGGAFAAAALKYYPGSGDYDVLISSASENNVYGYAFGEEAPELLFNWLDIYVDLHSSDIKNITILPDGRIICTNAYTDWDNGKSGFELIVLTRMLKSELPEKTVLTLATFGLSYDAKKAVVDFNRSSLEYLIEVEDYSQFNAGGDMSAGLARLTTEITSGKVPDILDVSELPYVDYAAKGFLADLYPLIDADPELSRDDFVQAALRVGELDGSLYKVFPYFYINTVVGHPSVVGHGMGWTAQECMAVLDANPGADIPMGGFMSKTLALLVMMRHDLDAYIDMEAGAVSFDSPDFARLLELCSRFPDDFDWETIDSNTDLNIVPGEAIAAGRQIMMLDSIGDFTSNQLTRAMFGGDIVYKGYPSADRNGHSFDCGQTQLAIMEQSPNKDGAWAFVRTFLSEDLQLGSGAGSFFPTNQAAFDRKLSDALGADYGENGARINDFQLARPTQAEIDLVLSIIDTASRAADRYVDDAVINIIREGAADYFSGLCSAEDAARVIQSRVSIWLSERS